ncbi:MAG: hypothetical protein U1G05_13470 [Kiritimatiellia bacterium]
MESLRREAEATTRHGKLVSVECFPTNNTCFVRFAFSTGDAAGQNMVTRATEAACWILHRRDVCCCTLSWRPTWPPTRRRR